MLYFFSMDILSHGLWGGLLFGRKSRRDFSIAFLFGIIPDLASFGPLFISQIFIPELRVRPDYSSGSPDLSLLPEYVTQIYNYTHSLVIFLIIFLIVWAIRRKPQFLMLAWPLHVLYDIPFHTQAFFPTPFLWPISNLTIDGVAWGDPRILIPNWIGLIVFYVVWYVLNSKKEVVPLEK